MGIVDIMIILFLLVGAIVGFKQGVLKKITSFVGTFAIIIVAFMFKNQLSVIFYENLPFLNFWGAFKGLEVLNILFYEIMAFAFIFALLWFALRVLLVVTGLLEGLLKLTMILSLPSKLLGAIVGVVEYYVYAFLILFIVSLPVFNVALVKESNFANKILSETPLLKGYADETVYLYGKVYNIIENKENKTTEQVDNEILAFMIDNKVVTTDSINTLIERNKLHVNDKEFIDKYNLIEGYGEYEWD